MANPAGPSPHDEEEYQFTDVEKKTTDKYTAATVSSSAVESGRGKSRIKNPLVILVGIVVGVFCLYKLYGLFVSAHSSAAKPAVAAAPTTQASPAKMPAAPAVVEKPVHVLDNMLKDKVLIL